MGNFSQGNAQVGQHAFQSGQARARGVQERAQALQQAYSLETEAEKNSYLAMQNMQAMRKNQSAAVAADLVQAGSSGFMASSGSKRVVQATTQASWEQAIANANKSNVIADENARNQANAYRRYGEQAVTMANIEADYYNTLRSSAAKSRWWYLVGDSFTLGGQLGLAYGGGSGGTGGAASTAGNAGAQYSYVSPEGFTGRARI